MEEEEGCVRVPESILKREQERTERLLRKKEGNLDGQANQAHLLHFITQFKLKQQQIEEGLAGAESAVASERSEIFHRVATDLNLLHRHLASGSGLLTPYDLRRFQDVTAGLEKRSAQAQIDLVPKKKFGFRKKVKNGENDTNGEKKESERGTDGVDSDAVVKSVEECALDGPGFQNRENERLELGREEVRGRDVTLSHLRGCTVIVHGCPSSVFVRSISDTVLMLGPVTTSVLLYGATNCTVTSFCHQMRIHDSFSSDFYVQVSTDPIIENCRDVRFAPYNYDYPTLDGDVSSSRLDPSVNKWDNVQDFDWLVVSRPSPYWSVLPPSERRSHWPD